jgi:hypothetical protein
MVNQHDISREYHRLNIMAGQTENELDHKSLMDRINLYELYFKYYMEKDTILVYKLPHHG